MESAIYHAKQLLWLIILHLCIDVHSCFAIFMSGKILNRLGINTRIKQICNIGVPELMGRHLKIDAVHHIAVVGGPLPQHGCHGMRDFLAVDIAVISPLPDGAGSHIAPHPAPLCFREGSPVPVGDHEVRGRILLDGLQALHQLGRDGDRPLCRLCLQVGQDDRPVVLRVPGPADNDVWGVPLKEDAVPLEGESLLPAQTGIKTQHDKRIGWQAPNRVQEAHR